MKKIQLFNQNQISEALSNICFNSRINAEELELALEEASTGEEFLNTATELTRLTWKIVKDTDEVIQISYTDRLGNISYLRGFKEQSTKISQNKIKSAEKCLIDNGVNPNDVKTVLSTIGYILLGEEIYS